MHISLYHDVSAIASALCEDEDCMGELLAAVAAKCRASPRFLRRIAEVVADEHSARDSPANVRVFLAALLAEIEVVDPKSEEGA